MFISSEICTHSASIIVVACWSNVSFWFDVSLVIMVVGSEDFHISVVQGKLIRKSEHAILFCYLTELIAIKQSVLRPPCNDNGRPEIAPALRTGVLPPHFCRRLLHPDSGRGPAVAVQLRIQSSDVSTQLHPLREICFFYRCHTLGTLLLNEPKRYVHSGMPACSVVMMRVET